MINVELSNIWSCVSLPNLLSSEQALFEAHLKLRRNQPGFDDFLGWLGCGDAMIARTISAVERAADTICRQSQVLVVAGMGESWLGAPGGGTAAWKTGAGRTARRALCGRPYGFRRLSGSV